MKKMFLVVLCLAVFASLAMAQNYAQGSGIMGIDVLGAHQNGGRGCAGCHAPHSGGQGGGGNAATNAAKFNDSTSGDNALFGQDLTPLYTQTFGFGSAGEFQQTLPANSDVTGKDEEVLRGIAMCLACHDGNLAKGQMMVGTSYEKRLLLLPANVYGPNAIPTLLGNEGNGAGLGNYKNDHPVGEAATLGAAHLTKSDNTGYVQVGFDANGISAINYNPATPYANFVANYGAPALAGTPWAWGVANPNGNTDPSKVFLLCTTCHNQHSMYIYTRPPAYTGKATFASAQSGLLPTYFFINGPYNPGSLANDTGKNASSATQFCRQCHFTVSNEYFGVNTVTTAY